MSNKRIVIISDGIGDTAREMADAALAQFGDKNVEFSRHIHVMSEEHIERLFSTQITSSDFVIYTIVSRKLREFIDIISREKNIRSFDLLGPILLEMSNYLSVGPTSEPGLLRIVNDDYFNRVGAMEFTLNHDDGKNLESLHLADIILIGISRTSKTPLSVYLSQQYAMKVVNIPVILGTTLPQSLFEVSQRKVIALAIAPEELRQIRLKRLTRLGAEKHTGDYASMSKVVAEVEFANSIFRENRRWPVFDVTNKAIEETAAEIIRLMNKRKNNPFK